MNKETTEVIGFNPEKKYQWSLDDKFEFTGREFDILNKSLGQFVNGIIDVPSILKIADAFAIVQNKMREYVENGTIKEYIESENNSN